MYRYLNYKCYMYSVMGYVLEIEIIIYYLFKYIKII